MYNSLYLHPGFLIKAQKKMRGMAVHKSKKSALILLTVLILHYLDKIVDICRCGDNEPVQNPDLKINNAQLTGG